MSPPTVGAVVVIVTVIVIVTVTKKQIHVYMMCIS